MQLGHRVFAMALFAGVMAPWFACLPRPVPGTARAWAHAGAAAVMVQLALGIATLLAQVPVPLAAAHQANALLVLAALTGLAFNLRHPGQEQLTSWLHKRTAVMLFWPEEYRGFSHD